MSKVVRYYVTPEYRFYGGWEGDPEIHHDPFPGMGYIQVPFPGPSAAHYWDPETETYYLPAEPPVEV